MADLESWSNALNSLNGSLQQAQATLGGIQKYRSAKATLQYQYKKQLEAYERQKQDARQNMLDAVGLQKTALARAGYSTASLDGSSVSQLATPNMTNSPTMQDFPNIGAEGVSAWNQTRMTDAQISLINEQARTQKAVADNADDYQKLLVQEKGVQIGYIKAQTGFTDTQKEEAEQRIEYLYQAYPEMLKKLGLENDQLQGSIESLAMKVKLDKQQFDFNTDHMPLQLKLASGAIMLQYKEGRLKDAQAQNLLSQIAVFNAEARKLNADAFIQEESASAQIALYSAKNNLTTQQAKGQNIVNELAEAEKDFKQWQYEYQKATSHDEKVQLFYNHLSKWTNLIGSTAGVMIGYGAIKNANTNAMRFGASQSTPTTAPSYGSPPAQWQP